ncbi:MAG: hypothetical protein IPI73_30815 [Betaproteobacteria bacterium]|nr:hypothetical protein [Betaproteobacteria bacterium]
MLEGVPTLLNVDYLRAREHYVPGKVLVFTGPIDEYFDYDLGKLKYRGQRRVHEYHPDAGFLQPCGQVNNPAPMNGDHIRSLEWKHMMDPRYARRIRGTVISHETPFTPEDPSDYEYPFPDEANAALYRRYRERADRQEGLLICGRLGEYRYYDMDQAIARARLLARNLLTPLCQQWVLTLLAPRLLLVTPRHPEVARIEAVQAGVGAGGLLQVLLPRRELLLRPDHEVDAVRHAGNLVAHAGQHRRVDALHTPLQFVGQIRRLAQPEHAAAKARDHVRRDAVGKVCRHALAPCFEWRGGARFAERFGDRVLDQRGIRLAGAPQFIDDKAQRLRQFRRALGVIAETAGRRPRADPVAVRESGAPGFHEDAVRAAAGVDIGCEVVEQLVGGDIGVTGQRRGVHDHAALRIGLSRPTNSGSTAVGSRWRSRSRTSGRSRSADFVASAAGAGSRPPTRPEVAGGRLRCVAPDAITNARALPDFRIPRRSAAERSERLLRSREQVAAQLQAEVVPVGGEAGIGDVRQRGLEIPGGGRGERPGWPGQALHLRRAVALQRREQRLQFLARSPPRGEIGQPVADRRPRLAGRLFQHPVDAQQIVGLRQERLRREQQRIRLPPPCGIHALHPRLLRAW